MKIWLTRVISVAVSAALAVPVGAYAQGSAQEAVPASASQGESAFSQQQLDQMLAPIALYPDALLAQVLMAATYPLDVVAAARWVKANPNVKDKALEDAMQAQSWDPSVKSLAAFPQVLTMMNEKLDWTQMLGDAFLAQQAQVMDTVQALRQRAAKEGNLESTPEQVVKTEVIETKTVYVIQPAKPEVVYVPTYNPTVVYGSWWWPAHPPYHWYPPGYVARSAFWFGVGVAAGSSLWGGCNWGHREINININRYNSFNRTTIVNNKWTHNVKNRRGVAYRDRATAQRYNRASGQQAVQSREAFRGRAEARRADLRSPELRREMDRATPKPSAGTRDLGAGAGGAANARGRASGSAGSSLATGSRDLKRSRAERPSAETRDVQRGRGGGAFSGIQDGGLTRDFSARGKASRQSMSEHKAPRGGGGARGGGGRRAGVRGGR